MTGSPDWNIRYWTLRAALVAYDRALREHALAGEQWLDSSELDRLYAAVLQAADIDSPAAYFPQSGPE